MVNSRGVGKSSQHDGAGGNRCFPRKSSASSAWLDAATPDMNQSAPCTAHLRPSPSSSRTTTRRSTSTSARWALRSSATLALGGGKRWVTVGVDGGARLLLAKADGAEQAARIGDQTGGRVGFFLETDDFCPRPRALPRRAACGFSKSRGTSPMARRGVRRSLRQPVRPDRAQNGGERIMAKRRLGRSDLDDRATGARHQRHRRDDRRTHLVRGARRLRRRGLHRDRHGRHLHQEQLRDGSSATGSRRAATATRC